MRKKRSWTRPSRHDVTPKERAETARMLIDWLGDKHHAPAGPTACEKVVRDLLDVINAVGSIN
jgi:hypothetical protein